MTVADGVARSSGPLAMAVAVAVAAALAVAAATPAGEAATPAALALHAAAAGAGCAPAPEPGATPPQVAAVHADRVAAPAATRPIAVLDSGVDASAPALAGRVLAGVSVVPGEPGTADTEGHGTAVAALAAGAGAARGISPTSTILPVRVFDTQGRTTPTRVVEGIRAALAAHAGVINLSAAAPARHPPGAGDRAIQSAIDAAVTRGTIVVVPSGNEGRATLDAPAAYAHVIAVGATDESGLPAPFSDHGAGLDLMAPGSGLITAAPKARCATGYQIISGTSFAAPAVAGAAALAQALHPGIDATALADLLRLHADASAGPAWTAPRGFGTLDVAAALAAPVPPGDPGEADDDVGLARSGRGPRLVARHAVVDDRLAVHGDPTDVFGVRLAGGERLTAAVTAPAGTRAGLALWRPRAAAAAPAAGRAGRLAASTSGRLRVVVRRTGLYWLSVVARATPPQGAPYRLTLGR